MDRALSMLGLCARAGRLAYGEPATVAAVRSKAARLAVLDEAAGPNTRKSVTDACSTHNVPLFAARDVGKAVGKPGRMAVAVLDQGFARRIAELFQG